MAMAFCSRNLQDLPEDLFAIVSASISPHDVLRLGATCRKLRTVCLSDKVWIPHCECLGRGVDLESWRSAMNSFRSVFRFLTSVQSLLGLWVHQNPELGNLVFVTWGFISVVGCRIIPQELGPNGFGSGLRWSPVFEIIGHSDGTVAFFLHGREEDGDLCYPGRFECSHRAPNVLLLEVEPVVCSWHSPNDVKSPNSPFANGEDLTMEENSKRTAKFFSMKSFKEKKKTVAEPVLFDSLAFGDRRRLLELTVPQVALNVPSAARGPLFPTSARPDCIQLSAGNLPSKNDWSRELQLLVDRRTVLLRMYTSVDPLVRESISFLDPESACQVVSSDNLLKTLCTPPAEEHESSCSTLDRKVPVEQASAKKLVESSTTTIGNRGLDSSKLLGIARFMVSKVKKVVGKFPAQNEGNREGTRNAEAKRLQLQEFLKQGNKVALRLHAVKWKPKFYRSWPIMQQQSYALYKIPEQKSEHGREFAGLWGATFGWPPEAPTDKPGKALFLLMLSYDETTEGRKTLIATKILEGTHYVVHPNGSAMFLARMDEPSSEEFPWTNREDELPVLIMGRFRGDGIASGYGFRYPGSRPGDLFVEGSGLLIFVWRESKTVLTLKRINLQECLQNGERVSTLPPVSNFAYLTKSYSNVFAGAC